MLLLICTYHHLSLKIHGALLDCTCIAFKNSDYIYIYIYIYIFFFDKILAIKIFKHNSLK